MASSTAEPPVAAARVSKTAVAALFKHRAAESTNSKPQLLPEDDYIYLTLTLKKIPSTPRSNPFKIPLPHPVLDPASSQLCLIIDDRPKTPTPPSDHIKKLIKARNIPVSKVIRVSKLKTDYKPFEAKRKLCGSFDLFLVDKRVVHLLPRLLGKEFFKRRKFPLGVDLGKKNLKEQVERALGSALLYLRSGTSCVMKVGKVGMEVEEVVENVVGVIEGLAERVPKKWEGVRSLHLKFSDSVALPVYQAMPDLKLRIEGLKEEKEREGEVGKVSDIEGEKKEGSGRKDGKSGKKKSKGRIHEVHYMDVGEGIESGDDDDVDESEQVKDEVVEGDLIEESGVDEAKNIENEDVDGGKKVGKKRSKSKAMKEEVLGVSHEEKRIKKKAKKEKSESEKPKKGGMEGKKKSGPEKSENIAKVKDAEMKGKKRRELEKSPSEKKVAKVKDVKKHKKRVAGK